MARGNTNGSAAASAAHELLVGAIDRAVLVAAREVGERLVSALERVEAKLDGHGPHCLTIKEVMARLGVSESFVRQQITSGELRAYQHGRMVRVLVSELEAYINRHSTGGDWTPVADALAREWASAEGANERG